MLMLLLLLLAAAAAAAARYCDGIAAGRLAGCIAELPADAGEKAAFSMGALGGTLPRVIKRSLSLLAPSEVGTLL